MISKTSKLGFWAGVVLIVAGLTLSVPPAVIAQVPVIGSLVQGINAHFGNLVAGANGLGLTPWSNEGFTQGSWLSFNNNGGSNGETDFINYHPSLTGGFAWFTPNTSSLGSPVMSLSPSGTLTVAQVAGNAATSTTAATASALTAAGTNCGSTSGVAAYGVDASGNALCKPTKTLWTSTTSVCTTGGTGNLQCTFTLTWPAPQFTTTTYLTVCQGYNPSGPFPVGWAIVGQSTSTVTVQISNGVSAQGGAVSYGSFACQGNGS
jgi:hypothetical protein